MNTEKYLLTCLAEECAELAQAASKAIRFGLENAAEPDKPTNLQRINEELMDILAVIEILDDSGILVQTGSRDYLDTKKSKVYKMLYLSGELGIVDNI